MGYKLCRLICIVYGIFMWAGLFLSAFVDGYPIIKLGIIIGALFSIFNLKVMKILEDKKDSLDNPKILNMLKR